MDIQQGDTITWSTLPDGIGVVKSGVVEQIKGRWLHVTCTEAPEGYQEEIGQQEIVLVEFIIESDNITGVEAPHFYL